MFEAQLNGSAERERGYRTAKEQFIGANKVAVRRLWREFRSCETNDDYDKGYRQALTEPEKQERPK